MSQKVWSKDVILSDVSVSIFPILHVHLFLVRKNQNMVNLPSPLVIKIRNYLTPYRTLEYTTLKCCSAVCCSILLSAKFQWCLGVK